METTNFTKKLDDLFSKLFCCEGEGLLKQEKIKYRRVRLTSHRTAKIEPEREKIEINHKETNAKNCQMSTVVRQMRWSTVKAYKCRRSFLC